MSSAVSPAPAYPKITTPQRLELISEISKFTRNFKPENAELTWNLFMKKTLISIANDTVLDGGSVEERSGNEAMTPGRQDFKRKTIAKTSKSFSKLSQRSRVMKKQEINCDVPVVSYSAFRTQHINRRNSTTPSKRLYQDYSIGADTYNPLSTAKRVYKPQVIRLTARSKITLHSSFPIQLPDRTNSAPRKTKVKGGDAAKDTQSTASPALTKSPERVTQRPLTPETNEPLALTFGEKLAKVKRIAEASRCLA